MVGFEKVLRAVKVIKDQIQDRSQSLLNLARGYFISKKHFLYSQFVKRIIAIEAQLYFLGLVGL